MGKTIGRKLVDISQKARGRQALRYEFEVVPFFCGDIPEGIDKVVFAWERGTKLFITDAEPVNPKTHAVFWRQYLRQTATIYKENNEFLSKEFSFKIQEVKPKGKDDQRKTIGKVHVDLAQFCTEQSDAQPQEVFLKLKPVGKLKCSIKATWLRDAKVDFDAQTEVTFNSEHVEEEEGWEQEEHRNEQDLSGFDPETGEPIHSRNGHGASTSEQYDEQYDEENSERRRRKKKKHRKRRHQLPDEIPEGFDYPQDEHGYEDGHAEAGTSGAGNQQGSTTSGTKPKPAGAGTSGGPPKNPADMNAGRQVHKRSIRDILCCCFPRHGGVKEDPLEGDALLAQQRVVEMRKAPGGGANHNTRL